MCRIKVPTDIPTKFFTGSVLRNLKRYRRCLEFWWPLIQRRAVFHGETASDLLLNPVFRWAFLKNEKKLGAVENQLEQLCGALGPSEFRWFQDQFVDDLANHPVENDAHNRMLSALVEVKAMLDFAFEGHSITLIHDNKGKRKPDFCAKKDGELRLVEVKYIRPPDKLQEFLFRWWQAQNEVSIDRPLGRLPHLKFEWQPIQSRNELSKTEIGELNKFFTHVFLQSKCPHNLANGRFEVKYIPDRRLPPC